MRVSEFAVQYVASKGLARTPIYSANRFARLVGDLDIADVQDSHMVAFQKACETAGLGAWSIRGALKDLRTLVRESGRDVTVPRVQKPEPDPQPVPLDHIDSLWQFCGEWSRQWIAISFWTGLRLADVIRLQQAPEQCARDGRIEWTASKTRRRQRWPLPKWLEPFFVSVHLPYGRCDHHNGVLLRAELERCSALANIDRVLPSQIRDTSLREWCRADFHVGQILHGCRLGTIGHYVDPLDVIAPVAPRVRLPKCFGATAQEDDIAGVVERLDPEAKRMVREMAVRLCR